MKRTLTILLALVGLTMSAQIQNKLLGFTLGRTTRSEVYDKYQNERYFKENVDGYSVGGIVFAGQKWDITTFEFYNNQLSNIQFSLVDLGTPIYVMDSVWDYLRLTLLDKYGEYNYFSTSEYLFFEDGKTNLAISYKYAGENKALILIYSDSALKELQRQAEEDEL